MELLKIHPQTGQWSLVEKQERGGEFAGESDQDFRSFHGRTLEGTLPVDHGRRGMVSNVGNRRASRQMSDHRMEAKVPTPVKSAAVARNPGMGLN